MLRASRLVCVSLGLTLMGLGACSPPAEKTAEAPPAPAAETTGPALLPVNATPEQKIESAMRAGPKSVGADATIIDVGADGMMTTLRQGTNGFTCMADNPGTPGPDPMCGDANAMEWAHAWMMKTAPPTGKIGFMYMLEGGTDASNTDPYAQAPTAENNWIKTGPHVMLVGDRTLVSAYPRTPQPNAAAPYVMWPDTPYEHLMIPVS